MVRQKKKGLSKKKIKKFSKIGLSKEKLIHEGLSVKKSFLGIGLLKKKKKW